MLRHTFLRGLPGVALLAAACATVPGPSVVTPREGVARVSQLQALDDFRLDGRLAAAVGQEGFSATLAWAQRGARSELELRAPLGFGTARIVREARSVLAEMGLRLPESVRIRVWDTTADTRYMVLPVRPEHTKGWSEEELAKIVTKDAMIGVARRAASGLWWSSFGVPGIPSRPGCCSTPNPARCSRARTPSSPGSRPP